MYRSVASVIKSKNEVSVDGKNKKSSAYILPIQIMMAVGIALEGLLRLLELAISKDNEYRADKRAAEIIGERHMISALQKMYPCTLNTKKEVKKIVEIVEDVLEPIVTFPTTSNRIKAIRKSSNWPFIRWGY